MDIGSQLSLGSQGSDVTNLQTFLASDSTVYPSGLVTGYYGTLTQQAVKNFQAKYGLPQVGNVGPLTLAKINSLIDSGQTTTTTGTPGAAPIMYNIAISTSTPPTVTNPGTTNGTTASTYTDTVGISWNTDQNSEGKIFYSPIPLVVSEGQSPQAEPTVSGYAVSDLAYTTSKNITIPNLNASSTYYYMIEAINSNGNVSVTWPNTFATQ